MKNIRFVDLEFLGNEDFNAYHVSIILDGQSEITDFPYEMEPGQHTIQVEPDDEYTAIEALMVMTGEDYNNSAYSNEDTSITYNFTEDFKLRIQGHRDNI